MAACPKCGARKTQKNRHGMRSCRRCGTLHVDGDLGRICLILPALADQVAAAFPDWHPIRLLRALRVGRATGRLIFDAKEMTAWLSAPAGQGPMITATKIE